MSQRLHYNARHIFHRRVWYRALSLRYACIRRSDILTLDATFVPNFVSVATSVAELVHAEKWHTRSITQSLTQLLTHSLTQLI